MIDELLLRPEGMCVILLLKGGEEIEISTLVKYCSPSGTVRSTS
jgi:hypothetical protein